MTNFFTNYENSYNLLLPTDRNSFFMSILIDQVSAYKSPTVVDIGCGEGISGCIKHIEVYKNQGS